MKKINYLDSVIQPIITEKATSLSEHNKVIFKVRNDASKKSIKKNIEKIFKVNVIKINTITKKSKSKIIRGRIGFKKGYKKAMITLKKGQSIFFFPEGTSTDGSIIKQFKSSLFEVCYGETFKEKILGSVQPLTIIYKSPIENDPSFYSFWREEDTIFENIKKIINKVRHGRVRLVFHKPIEFNKYGNRKHLSYACYKAVNNGLVSPENSF